MHSPHRCLSDLKLEDNSEIAQFMNDEQRQRNRVGSCETYARQKQAIRDWLDDLIEDQLEVNDEFKAKVQRAKQEIADGVYSRVRKPKAGD